MKERVSRRRLLGAVGTLTGVCAAGAVLAACGATPTPQVIEKEVTKIVEGTPQVVKETVVVTQEVEKVVKETSVVEVMVTPTPIGGAEASINVFDYDPTGTDAWVQADKDFEAYFTGKYPHIKVTRDQAPWTGFTEKLLTSIAGGAKYDVIYGYWEWLPLFMENDVVGPLDDLIAQDSEISADDFFDYAKETSDGKTYGLAWFISGWLQWYNKTRVEAAGQADLKELNKQGKWDYTAWYEFAKAMTGDDNGTPIFGWDMSATRSPTAAIMMNWAYGSEFWNEDFSQCILDSAENVEVWKYIQQFYAEKLTPTPGDMGQGESGPGYTNGRIVGTMAGQWYTRTIVQEMSSDNPFDIGMVPFAKGPVDQVSIAALNSFYFSKAPENPQAAFAWYKERSFSDASSKIYASIGGGRFPSRKSVAPATVYAWEDTEVYEAIRPTLRTYRTAPKEAEFNALYQAAWDEMVLQTRPVEEILAQLAQEASQLAG
jgi:ABC-type glycerol-3-phosphate transport system substrate-binding protein